VAFPQKVVRDVLDKWLPGLVLRPWQQLGDTRIARLTDHELILILRQRGYDGLVTVNYKMLEDPLVLAMIQQTRFTVVACQGTSRRGVGDDYLAATGLLLMNLPNIASHFAANKPQSWMLRATISELPSFKNYVKASEARFGFSVKRHRFTPTYLNKPVLTAGDQRTLF
jgi:hypothetical protein